MLARAACADGQQRDLAPERVVNAHASRRGGVEAEHRRRARPERVRADAQRARVGRSALDVRRAGHCDRRRGLTVHDAAVTDVAADGVRALRERGAEAHARVVVEARTAVGKRVRAAAAPRPRLARRERLRPALRDVPTQARRARHTADLHARPLAPAELERDRDRRRVEGRHARADRLAGRVDRAVGLDRDDNLCDGRGRGEEETNEGEQVPRTQGLRHQVSGRCVGNIGRARVRPAPNVSTRRA